MNLNQQSDEQLDDETSSAAPSATGDGDAGGFSAGIDGALTDEDGAGFVSEEKKPLSRSSLVLGLVVVASIAGLWVMHKRSGPQSAGAATAETAKANETINQFLSNGEKNVKMMDQMLKDTEKFVSAFLKYPSASQVPLSDLQTNPFRHQSGGDDANEDDARSVAEAQKKREEERLAVLKAVQGLQLQSVMHSDANKACMINNALYQEGQQVESFTIEKINPKGVIVKNGAYRFELRMQR